MKVVHIVYNAVAAKVLEPTREVDLALQQILSYQVAGAEQTDTYKTGTWDGRSSFYEMRKHRFPSGFAAIVKQRLTKLGYEVKMRRRPFPKPMGPENPRFDDFGYDDPRYAYQPNTVGQLLRHGRMIAQVATGGGKSRIAQIATARICRPTLFLTTRSVLMYQMRDHFEDMMRELDKNYGKQFSKKGVGVLGDGDWKPRPWINVGMVQTFAARLKKPSPFDPVEKQTAKAAQISETKGLLEKFEFVILEEAHEASGFSYYEVMKRCKNAEYRLALTATPFMKEDEEANMNLMACAGPIGIRVSEKELIDSGILAKPFFRFLTPDRPRHMTRRTYWGAAYRLGIVESVSRNKLAIQEAMMANRHGLSVLILVQQRKHGKILEKFCRENGLKTKFIFGESTKAVRAAALNALESGKLDVLIGSNILDVGVDVPALGMVILAGGGKAEVQFRQRIGRGLRAKKEGPNVAFIVDFMDKWNVYTERHSLARLKIIQETPGFGENILSEDENFPYVKRK